MSTMRRKELTPEEQKNFIMSQIGKIGPGAPPAASAPPEAPEALAVATLPATAPVDASAGSVASVTEDNKGAAFRPLDNLPTIEEAQPAQPQYPVSSVKISDVVQVTNPRNSHYGLCFIIGGIADGQAHGFYMAKGPRKEFITAPVADLHSYGKSAVMSREAVSREWQQQHGGQK